MSDLFMGGEMGAFVPSGSGAHENTGTTYDAYNSAFCRCAIQINGSADYIESADTISGDDLWCHFDMSARAGGSTTTEHHRFQWLDGSDTAVIRLTQIYSGNTLRLDYWNGLAWTSAGSISVQMDGIRQTIDIHVVCNTASGSAKLYLSGTKRIDSGTIDLSGITSMGKARFYGGSISTLTYQTYVSQVIVSEDSTIGCRLQTRYPSGAGASSDWVGAYTSIDEAVYSDADFILSDTANDISTFAQTGTDVTGYTVRSVGVTARAKCDAAGPQNLQLALRSSGTNYFSSTIALDAGYTANVNVWNTDPATSAAWVNTAVSTLQPGVKSIT